MTDRSIEGKHVLLVVPPTQFREEEVFEPKRILEKNGARVTVASTQARTCRGMREGVIDAEVAIAEARAEDYDALVLAGGSSVPEFFWKDKSLAELVRQAAEGGRLVAAIALATVVLAKANLLSGKEATVYYLPEALEELKSAGATYVERDVVVVENLVMGEGPASAGPFAETIVAQLSREQVPAQS